MSKRKYPEVKGYWVYSIKIPSINKYYIGVSQMQCCQRWHKSAYESSSLAPYLNEWDSMVKTVLIDGLSTKEQAYQYEGRIIDALSMNNLCLNEQRSGLITNDINDYMKELRKNNPERREQAKQLCKQWRENNKEKAREYNKQYRENNKEREKQRHKQWKEDNPDYYKQYYQCKKLKQQHASLQQ